MNRDPIPVSLYRRLACPATSMVFFRLFSRTYPTRHEQRACMPLFYFLFRFARSIHTSLSPFAPFCHFVFSLRRWSDFEQSAATVAVSAAAVVFYYRRCRSFSAFATVSVAAALRLQLHAHAAAVDGSEGGRVFLSGQPPHYKGQCAGDAPGAAAGKHHTASPYACRHGQAPHCFAFRGLGLLAQRNDVTMQCSYRSPLSR